MRKNILLCVLAMVLILLLAGCGCKHEWYAATCAAPKTCSLCGETEGESLPHTWKDATCTDAKICTVCETTEGVALGHTWKDATCTDAKVCTVCETTEGDALGHTWEEATTEAPQTCSVCKETSGTKLQTDARFTTASTKALQGTWICDMTLTDEMMGLDNFGGTACRMTIEFGNTGKLTMKANLKDEADFLEKLKAYTIEQTYASLAQQGLSKEAADQAMLDAYGLNVPDYVAAALENYNPNDIFAAYNSEEVYYVEGNTVYTALTWNAKFEESEFKITGDELVIEALCLEEDGPALQWKKLIITGTTAA